FNAVNRYPDVEHLVPVHLQFPIVRKSPEKPMAVAQTTVSQTSRNGFETGDLDGLIHALSAFRFDAARPAGLTGKLLEMQEAYAHLMARYLKAALEATSKPTPGNPNGKILIHPAMKLITGDPQLTASKAADLIKRLLRISPIAVESLLEDSILRGVYE